MSVGENEATPTPPESVGVRDAAPGSVAPSEPDPASAEAPSEAVTEPIAVDPAVVALTDELAAAKRDLEQAQARLRAVSKAYTELQTEMRAFKDRMEARAKLDSELQAFDRVKTFFDPVMNLKRSVSNPGDDVTVLVEGLRMVHHQFMEALAKLGLEEVPGVGAPFDPNLHEAIAVAPVTDPAQDGVVLEVHTTGYRVRGRVLQAAQVVIGKRMETSGEA